MIPCSNDTLVSPIINCIFFTSNTITGTSTALVSKYSTLNSIPKLFFNIRIISLTEYPLPLPILYI